MRDGEKWFRSNRGRPVFRLVGFSDAAEYHRETGLPSFGQLVWPVKWLPASRSFQLGGKDVSDFDLIDPLDEYRRKDRPPLYLRVLEIDTSDYRAVGRFLSRYGHLNPDGLLKSSNGIQTYSLDDFTRSVRELRVVTGTVAALQDDDTEGLREAWSGGVLSLVPVYGGSDYSQGVGPIFIREFLRVQGLEPTSATVHEVREVMRRWVASFIGHYLRVVHMSLTFQRRGFEIVWSGGSDDGLLPALYLMLALDMTSGRGIGYCGRCGEFYRKARVNAVHSEACGAWKRKRKQRGRVVGLKIVEGDRS